DAGCQLLPIGLVDQERQMTQRPKPLGCFAGRAIGHSGFAKMAVGRSETPLDVCRRQRGERINETRPHRACRPVLRDELVGDARQPNIVPPPLRSSPIARTGLGSLAAGPAASLVSRHATLPPKALSSMQE